MSRENTSTRMAVARVDVSGEDRAAVIAWFERHSVVTVNHVRETNRDAWTIQFLLSAPDWVDFPALVAEIDRSESPAFIDLVACDYPGDDFSLIVGTHARANSDAGRDAIDAAMLRFQEASGRAARAMGGDS